MTTTNTHPNAELGRRMLAALESGDRLAVEALVHPEHVDHAPPSGPLHGQDGVLGVLGWLAATFADMEHEVQDLIATDDRVVARVRFSATHVGELMGVPATGRPIEAEHVHLWRVADGRLAEHWMVRDDLAVLDQLASTGAEATR